MSSALKIRPTVRPRRSCTVAAETLTSTGSPVRVNHTSSRLRNESMSSRASSSHTVVAGLPISSSSW